MEISRKYKLEKAVSTDPHRTRCTTSLITKHHAIVTNGHILAVVPVKSDDTDVPGLLSIDALKLGRKATSKEL
jgi:hypothetical protein